MDPRSWFADLTAYFLYILFVATLGPFLFGFHLSELNPPEDVITCKKKSIHVSSSARLPQCIPMDSTQWGAVSSLFTLGGLFGALLAGPVASRYGRLRAMQYTTAFFALGPVFEALAPNIGIMAFGRFISGIGAGSSVVVVPIYISEIAPPAEKGFFGSFTQIMINIGILMAQLFGYFLSRDSLWRLILAAGGIFGVLQLAGLCFAVESPKWMADRGQHGIAKRNLRKIRGRAADIEEEVKGWGLESPGHVDDEEETLLGNDDRMSHHSGGSTKSQSKHETVGILQVLRHPEHNKATVLVMVVMVSQQLCGINSIIMYGVSLLSTLLQSNSVLLNLFVSAMNIVITALCAPLVDKLGRKFCIISSMIGMGVSSLLLAVSMLNILPILSAVSVILFVSSYALGLGPVPFILSSELVGPEAVGATQSWALASNWIATFLVAQFFPIANARLHGNVYFIFAGLSALFATFVWLFIPETKGKKNADEVWGRTRRED